MPNTDEKTKKRKIIDVWEGYQPTKGNLDPSNPPQGGSGVPSKTNKSGDKGNQKNK